MSVAYGRPQPYGLYAPSGFNRWTILDGDASYWTPYNLDYYDTLALDGLYYLSQGNATAATAKWDRMLAKSGYSYDGFNQRYAYPDIAYNYTARSVARAGGVRGLRSSGWGRPLPRKRGRDGEGAQASSTSQPEEVAAPSS